MNILKRCQRRNINKEIFYMTNKKMISLEVSEELKEALRVEAFNRSLSISALIRQILEDNLHITKDNTNE